MGNFNKLSFPCLIICRIKLQEDAKVHFQKIKGFRVKWNIAHRPCISWINNLLFILHNRSKSWQIRKAIKTFEILLFVCYIQNHNFKYIYNQKLPILHTNIVVWYIFGLCLHWEQRLKRIFLQSCSPTRIYTWEKMIIFIFKSK